MNIILKVYPSILCGMIDQKISLNERKECPYKCCLMTLFRNIKGKTKKMHILGFSPFLVCCPKYCRWHQKNQVKRSMHFNSLHNRTTADGDNTFLSKLMPCRYLWAQKESGLYKFNLMRIQHKEDSIWTLDILHCIPVKREKNLTYLFVSFNTG